MCQMPAPGKRFPLGHIRPAAAIALHCALSVCFLAPPARAQIVNVLNEARDVKPGLSGRLAAGGKWQSGNAESIQADGTALMRYRAGRHLAIGLGSTAYGIANDATLADRQLGHLRYRLDLIGRLQGEAFVQGDRNSLRRRTVRTVFGLGPRFELFDGPVLWAAIGLAYMPEYERLGEGSFADSGAVRWNHRSSAYLSHSVVVTDRVKVMNTLIAQPAFDAIENLRAFSDLSLELALWSTVTLTFTHTLQLDTEPPESVRPVDAERKLTFAWSF